MNPTTVCPVCNQSLEKIEERYFRCPESYRSGTHSFDVAHYVYPQLPNHPKRFQYMLHMDGFVVQYWFGEQWKPRVLIRKSYKTDSIFDSDYDGTPNFDWSRITTDIDAVRKKLRLWRTFE